MMKHVMYVMVISHPFLPHLITNTRVGVSFEAEDIDFINSLESDEDVDMTSIKEEDFSNWFEIADEEVKRYHQLRKDHILHDGHICTKLMRSIINYIYTMKYAPKRERVAWKWDTDVLLFIQTLKRSGCTKWCAFFVDLNLGSLGKGRVAFLDISI